MMFTQLVVDSFVKTIFNKTNTLEITDWRIQHFVIAYVDATENYAKHFYKKTIDLIMNEGE